MKGLNYHTVYKYVVDVACDAPLHIGNALGGQEEVLIHPVTEKPFVQAASIAGVFRNYCLSIKPDVVETLFGSQISKEQNDQSRVRISDGEFLQNVRMELRPHVRIDRKTGSVTSKNESGQKFNMEYIGAGAEFGFTVYLYVNDETEILKDTLEEILAGIKAGNMQFGAKKSNGVGKVSLRKIAYKVFELRTSEGRRDWTYEDELPLSSYDTMYADKLPETVSSNRAYSIAVDGKTEGYIQIKSIAVSEFGENAPDSESIKNANDEYIVPGSSFKGSIRSQMEKIASYLGKSSMIEQSFGTENASDSSESITGNMIFSDTIIGDKESNDRMPDQHRIHIDKFTGGVFYKGSFIEKNAAGNMNLHIDILKKNNPDATLALLVFALRDLAIHTTNLGSGYNIGKGILLVDQINIEKVETGQKAALIFGEKSCVDDKDELLQNALNILKAVEG